MNLFAAWMRIEGNSDASVAKRVGVGVEYIWKLRTGKAALSPSFAWKFGLVYGFDLAKRLFTDTETNSHGDDMPVDEPERAVVA